VLLFSGGASFFAAGLALAFLSSLAIIFPNADLLDQFDLSLNFHPAAIRSLWVDTPCGAVGATGHRAVHPASFYPHQLAI
jgi:hypothetical protein